MSQYDTGYSDTTSTTSSSGSMLSAFFDNRDDAQQAVSKLRDLGIDSSNIRMTEGNANSAQAAAAPERHKGFFEALAEFFMPEEDRYTYAEGLNRGGFLVIVSNVPLGLYDEALDILDDEGSIDMDQRADSWRSEGWTGYSSDDTLGTTGTGIGSATGTYTSGSVDSDRLDSDREFAADDRFATDDRLATDRAYDSMAEDSEAIPVVQEELRVGKRDVSHGRVRVRSYMVEEPVEEQVKLRNERVVLERRPVDRALTGSDAAFQDRTIEAEEHIEEAVVSKEARVVEEIALRKEAEERSETISDTVRHTEVEIEDERGNSISDTDRSRGRI